MRKTVPTVATILVLVLLACLVFVILCRGSDFNPGSQMTGWSRIPFSLASGDGYVYSGGAPAAKRGPVPVLFLALLFAALGPQAFPVPIVVSRWLWDAASAIQVYFFALLMIMFSSHALASITARLRSSRKRNARVFHVRRPDGLFP